MTGHDEPEPAAPAISLHDFTDIDRSVESTYVAALEAFDRLPLLRELKALAIERTGIRPGPAGPRRGVRVPRYFGHLGEAAADAGAVDAAAGRRWTSTIETLHRADRLFGAIGYYLFTATLPG